MTMREDVARENLTIMGMMTIFDGMSGSIVLRGILQSAP